jgi:hypothetical protein
MLNILISFLIALLFGVCVYTLSYINQSSATIQQLNTKVAKLEQVAALEKEIDSTKSLLFQKQMDELHQVTQSVANNKSIAAQSVNCDTSYISYLPQIIIIGGVIVGFCFIYKCLMSSTAESALILKNQKDISIDSFKGLQKLLEDLLVNENAPINKQFEVVSLKIKELDSTVETYALEILRNQAENQTIADYDFRFG